MTFFLAYNVGIDWQEEFLVGRIVKFNRQSKAFALMLAMDAIGDLLITIPS